jgi:acetyl-CoA carboxylase, biotin carboxylase subunit
MLKRVLIANRGEIAVRVIRACHGLGIEAVLAVSSADRETLGAKLADRVVCVGPPSATHSYLNMPALVAAAVGTGCDAVHPGYGFLAERAAFARIVGEAKLVFVGPPPKVIDGMGDKVQSRDLAIASGVPVAPASGRVEADAALEFALAHGFPVLLKASAGGGGRGMRLVHEAGALRAAFDSAAAEANAAFGDSSIFVERYVERARHIEVQIMGDNHGNVVHYGERDCSVQRRYQKLIEEAPSCAITTAQRTAITDAAVRLAARIGYVGAGTVEFLVDASSGEYFFLEMNTRIQVEHPVTEMVTGADLVAEQLRVAGGAPLSRRQEEISVSGHAIECRINAESPMHDFRPSPGRLTAWQTPEGEGIRMDSHCYPGYLVPPYYDSMIGKLIVHAVDREGAIARMRAALDGLTITGVESTVPFHRAILDDGDFRDNRIRTRWIEEDFLDRWRAA